MEWYLLSETRVENGIKRLELLSILLVQLPNRSFKLFLFQIVLLAPTKFNVMVLTNLQKNLHLSWRAAFGPGAEELSLLSQSTPQSYFNRLLKDSANAPLYLDAADKTLTTLLSGMDDGAKKQQLTADQKKELRVKSRNDLKSLNLAWLNQMINSKQQLREKMSLFWHGHFATKTINIIYQQQLLDIIRTHALGNFADLLKQVSKSAAMINFLNANQNKKGHPNENFAREVMELFTLGRDNYSEKDIKESARAFTGWGAGIDGAFIFRDRQHDEDKKTFLGQTGYFNGDDILNIILEQKQTAKFITQKIYRYFVNDKIDNLNVEWLANRFFKNNYDIEKLMTDIFTSDWFYEEKNTGTKIKSPVELIAGIRRILPMQIQNEEVQLLLQRLLGQILFYPPNVAGWPGGRSWIDSSTLMMRLRIPQLIYQGDAFQMKPKDDDDVMMGMKDRAGRLDYNDNRSLPEPGIKRKGFGKKGQQIKAVIDWHLYTKQFEQVSRENLLSSISNLLLPSKNKLDEFLLKNYVNAESREAFIKTATIQLMSTPEYQLC